MAFNRTPAAGVLLGFAVLAAVLDPIQEVLMQRAGFSDFWADTAASVVQLTVTVCIVLWAARRHAPPPPGRTDADGEASVTTTDPRR